MWNAYATNLPDVQWIDANKNFIYFIKSFLPFLVQKHWRRYLHDGENYLYIIHKSLHIQLVDLYRYKKYTRREP